MATKKTMSPAMRKLSPRARGVVKKAAREIGKDYDLKPKGVARFKRSAARDIARGTGKGYAKAIVRNAAKNTTKAEAKGVKKVLSRQPASSTSSSTTAAAKRKVGIPKRGRKKPMPPQAKAYGHSKQVR